MKKLFAEPIIEVKSFASENIVTDSVTVVEAVTTADGTVNENAAVQLSWSDLKITF